MDDNETSKELPITNTTDPQPLESQPSAPENMEVHYEPHFKHHHHKKHLAEYAKEFLMIFFAVFLGFLAENLREHIAESGKEKEYVKGFISDIKQDSTDLAEAVTTVTGNAKVLDSINALRWSDYRDPIYKKNLFDLIKQDNLNEFSIHDVTLQQIKSSGDLRLLKKDNVADSLLSYYSDLNYLVVVNQHISDQFWRIMDIKSGLFNSQYTSHTESSHFDAHRSPLKDTSKLNVFFNKIIIQRGLLNSYNTRLKEALKSSTTLMAYLRKTYHLKDI